MNRDKRLVNDPNCANRIKRKILTVYRERDFSFYGSNAKGITGFTTETSVVVTWFCTESVNVARLAT